MLRQELPPESPRVIEIGGAGKEKPLDSPTHSLSFTPKPTGLRRSPSPRRARRSQPRPRAERPEFRSQRGSTHIRRPSYGSRSCSRRSRSPRRRLSQCGYGNGPRWRATPPRRRRMRRTAAYGTVYVETEPAGMEVWVNGSAAGRTPTQLSIPIGAAEIQLRHADRVRTLPLTIAPEEVLRLRVEL